MPICSQASIRCSNETPSAVIGELEQQQAFACATVARLSLSVLTSSCRKQRSWSSEPPSRFRSALALCEMMHGRSWSCGNSMFSGQSSLYLSPFSTWTCEEEPNIWSQGLEGGGGGGGPTKHEHFFQLTSSWAPGQSVTAIPFSSTSSTRSGALHLALSWSSIRYLFFKLRLHKRLGLNWHKMHPGSPQPVLLYYSKGQCMRHHDASEKCVSLQSHRRHTHMQSWRRTRRKLRSGWL